MKSWRRWQDWVNVVLGVWLFISPWVFGVPPGTAAAWDALVLGALIVIVGLWALAAPRWQVPEWGLAVLAVALVFSPTALAFNEQGSPALNAWIVGAVVCLLSLSAVDSLLRHGRLAPH